jgi:hypothetical protein
VRLLTKAQAAVGRRYWRAVLTDLDPHPGVRLKRTKLLAHLLAAAGCAAAGAAFTTNTDAEIAAGQTHIAAAQASVNACRPDPTTPDLAAALDLAPGQILHAGRCGPRRWALITPQGQTVTANGQVLAADPSGAYIQVRSGSDPCAALPVGLVFEWQLACP